MQRKKDGNIEWLEFDLLADIPDLVHGIFLRHGGISPEPYSSLNAGGGCGDDRRHIQQNLKAMQDKLGLSKIVTSNQAHGINIATVTDETIRIQEECDGLITQEKDIGLVIKHADCQAAIFYDPVNRALANVHSGWRGNVKNIYAQTVALLQKEMGSSPANLLVCISPSLGPMASEFKNYRTELPEEFWQFQVKPTYFNLWEISRHQLLSCGILSHHIEIAGMCTYNLAQDFFSYRRDKVTGRHATIAALKS